MMGMIDALTADAQPWDASQDGLLESLEPDLRRLREVLEQASSCQTPDLFVDYVAWLGRAGPSRNLPPAFVAAELDALHEEVAERDGVEASSTAAVGRALQILRATPCPLFEEVTAEDGELASLRRRYLGLLLAGLRPEALAMLADCQDRGLPVERLYLEILQPTLREIGQLWEAGQCSIAQEHFCSAVTREAIGRLAARASAVRPDGRVAMLVGVGRERHDIGLSMIADLLERRGWNAVMLGADTPVRDLAAAACAHRADLIGLSCTLAVNLGDLRAAIRCVRVNRRLAETPILVGGRPFSLQRNLWRQVGADAGAADAAAAVATAERLVPVARHPRRYRG